MRVFSYLCLYLRNLFSYNSSAVTFFFNPTRLYPTQHHDQHRKIVTHTTYIPGEAAGQAGRALGLRGGGAAHDDDISQKQSKANG